MVNLIGSTTTRGGLKVKALLDTTSYEPGQKIPDADMRALRLKLGGITQARLAEVLDLHPNTTAKWECGMNRPSGRNG